jgi:hypothetical protein
MQPDSKELLFKTKKGALRVPLNQVAGLNFPVPKASAPRTVRGWKKGKEREKGTSLNINGVWVI